MRESQKPPIPLKRTQKKQLCTIYTCEQIHKLHKNNKISRGGGYDRIKTFMKYAHNRRDINDNFSGF